MMSKSLYTSRAGWYSLKHPPTWEVEEDEACVTIYDPRDGVGALQISAYRTPEQQDSKTVLLEYLSDNNVTPAKGGVRLRESDGRSVASYDYAEPPWHKRVWFTSQDSLLLLITYNCKIEHKGKEEAAVEEIIRSIKLLPDQ